MRSLNRSGLNRARRSSRILPSCTSVIEQLGVADCAQCHAGHDRSHPDGNHQFSTHDAEFEYVFQRSQRDRHDGADADQQKGTYQSHWMTLRSRPRCRTSCTTSTAASTPTFFHRVVTVATGGIGIIQGGGFIRPMETRLQPHPFRCNKMGLTVSTRSRWRGRVLPTPQRANGSFNATDNSSTQTGLGTNYAVFGTAIYEGRRRSIPFTT